MPPKTRKLITLANCSSSVRTIVLVKSSWYTRIILCYVSEGENSKIKPAFAKYEAKHTQGSSVSTRICTQLTFDLILGLLGIS